MSRMFTGLPIGFLTRRVFAVLALYVIRFAGTAGVLGGIAYMINGITQASANIVVRVVYQPGADDNLRPGGESLPAGVHLSDGDLSLSVWNSTVAEQVLSRADALVGGLCMGVAALLLGALLNSVTRGRPFRKGNSARIAWLAVLVIVSSCASVLPGIAQGMVIDRAGLTGTFLPSSGPSWVSIVGAVLLLALALAFREGAAGVPEAAERGTETADAGDPYRDREYPGPGSRG